MFSCHGKAQFTFVKKSQFKIISFKIIKSISYLFRTDVKGTFVELGNEERNVLFGKKRPLLILKFACFVIYHE